MNELDFPETSDKKSGQSSSFFTVYEQREGINDASPDKLNSIKALNNEYFLGLDDKYLQGKKIVACEEPTTEDSNFTGCKLRDTHKIYGLQIFGVI